MDWQSMRRSDNVEDHRGRSTLSGMPMRLGLGGIVMVVIVGALFGINPLYLLGVFQEGGAPPPQIATQPPANDRQADFVRAILGDTEDTWKTLFQQSGKPYTEPRLTLFSHAVQSACGYASAAVGPFYCARDKEIYLDLQFFQELSQRFGAPGDFARAYVIAHEVGHHVQNLLGVMNNLQEQRARADEVTQNALSVRQELHADCLAGVWGHYAAQQGLIDRNDIAAALNAAAQIGDDRMQQRTQGHVVPEAFTHGSAAQRAQWVQRGLNSGDPAHCNTFTASQP